MQEVDKLQGKVRQSLKEMKIFLNGMGTVAANAVKELNNLKLKWQYRAIEDRNVQTNKHSRQIVEMSSLSLNMKPQQI